MIADIEAEVRYTRSFIGTDALDPSVMEAMRTVPREHFVPEGMKRYAFDNGPLPIGQGQTISQPYIVALMTHLLRARSDAVILEVGTGSGYQAAVLSRLVSQVYSVEIIPSLADQARRRLGELGYDNVEVRTGDAWYGWPEHAPYDGIIVTAAASSVPAPLLDQLRPRGRLVVPVGEPYSHQELVLLWKDDSGQVSMRSVLGVAFVPLTGDHGGSKD